MIFVIDNLKYDTEKMESISEKCKYVYRYKLFDCEMAGEGKEVQLWKTKHDKWLLTYTKGYSTHYAEPLTEEKAKELLMRYDLEKYEELFGELEEA